MFRITREIAATVRMVDELAQQSGSNGPRWSVLITDRSCIFQAIALLFALAGLFGLPIPIGAADLDEVVLLVGYLVTQGWALAERIFGKTRAVCTQWQAKTREPRRMRLARQCGTRECRADKGFGFDGSDRVDRLQSEADRDISWILWRE